MNTPSFSPRVSLISTLTMIMSASTFFGYAFGVLGPQLIKEFSLTHTELGLATTLFFLVGGLGSVWGGRLVDSLGAKRVAIGSLLVSSLCIFAMSVAHSFYLFVFFSALGGILLATGNPITNKVIVESIHPKYQGTVTGLKQSGVQIGAVLAGVVLASAITSWGWRIAFASMAAFPLFGLILTQIFLKPDQLRIKVIGLEGNHKIPRVVYQLAIYGFFMGAGISSINAYLPLYLIEKLSFSLLNAGAVVSLLGAVGVAARIYWGWMSGLHDKSRATLLSMSVASSLAMFLIVYADSLGNWAIWLAVVLLGTTAVAWNSVGMLFIVAQIRSENIGKATGIVLFGFYVGFSSSPLLFGLIVDHTNSFSTAWVFVSVLFAMASYAFFKDSSHKQPID